MRNGKSSRMIPGGVDQQQVMRSLRDAAAAKQGQSLAQLEADQEEVEALAAEVNQMCKERNIILEAQVIIQGTQMVSNVVFRKMPR